MGLIPQCILCLSILFSSFLEQSCNSKVIFFIICWNSLFPLKLHWGYGFFMVFCGLLISWKSICPDKHLKYYIPFHVILFQNLTFLLNNPSGFPDWFYTKLYWSFISPSLKWHRASILSFTPPFWKFSCLKQVASMEFHHPQHIVAVFFWDGWLSSNFTDLYIAGLSHSNVGR